MVPPTRGYPRRRGQVASGAPACRLVHLDTRRQRTPAWPPVLHYPYQVPLAGPARRPAGREQGDNDSAVQTIRADVGFKAGRTPVATRASIQPNPVPAVGQRSFNEASRRDDAELERLHASGPRQPCRRPGATAGQGASDSRAAGQHYVAERVGPAGVAAGQAEERGLGARRLSGIGVR
jgi:hypothetical protein